MSPLSFPFVLSCPFSHPAEEKQAVWNANCSLMLPPMIASPASSHVDAKQPLPRIRLSISHVMLWTATTGVLFGFLRPTFLMDFSIDGAGAEGRAFKILVFKVTLAVFAPIEGAALAGFVLAVWRLERPGPLFRA